MVSRVKDLLSAIVRKQRVIEAGEEDIVRTRKEQVHMLQDQALFLEKYVQHPDFLAKKKERVLLDTSGAMPETPFITEMRRILTRHNTAYFHDERGGYYSGSTVKRPIPAGETRAMVEVSLLPESRLGELMGALAFRYRDLVEKE